MYLNLNMLHENKSFWGLTNQCLNININIPFSLSIQNEALRADAILLSLITIIVFIHTLNSIWFFFILVLYKTYFILKC